MIETPPISTAPTRPDRQFRVPADLARNVANLQLRQRTFWAGWGGIITTMIIGVLVVALLVGWVLLWVSRPEGPSITLLTLGCIAFTAVLAILTTLQNRLSAYWRLRQAEVLFLTGISHNLRTPVAAIRVAAQTMEGQWEDPEARERLRQAIIHETRRLSLRVDNVLESSRLEVERLSVNQDPVDVSVLLGATVDAASGVVEMLDGSLETDLEDGVLVDGDVQALRLMLENLMDNAVKFSEGAPKIAVRLETRGNFALIRIMDQGIGFSAETHGLLFRRFERGDTRRPGMGLGLALSRAIARGHGGNIHLHSVGPEKGAVAEVWLPCLEEEGNV